MFRAMPFQETSLWLMFRCILEACMALKTGNDEPILDSKTGEYTLDIRQVRNGDAEQAWRPIIHSDMKARNSKS